MLADALNSSEEEVAALKEKHDKMKLKINMFSAVLREKEREVSVLEEQLEGVKLMGEMKQLKENAPQMVAAGIRLEQWWLFACFLICHQIF